MCLQGFADWLGARRDFCRDLQGQSAESGRMTLVAELRDSVTVQPSRSARARLSMDGPMGSANQVRMAGSSLSATVSCKRPGGMESGAVAVLISTLRPTSAVSGRGAAGRAGPLSLVHSVWLSRCLNMTTTVSLHEAKTHLSRPVDQAAKGREFIIAKAGKPMVRVVPLQAAPAQWSHGFLAGQGVITADVKAAFAADVEAMFDGPC